MSQQRFYPVSSAVQSEDVAYDDGETTTLYRMLAAFNNSINNGYDAASSSPSQMAFEDFYDGDRARRYEGNIAYSPRMSQGTMDCGTNMATGHDNNNRGGYDALAYDNMAAMSAGLIGGQLVLSDNLQLDTAPPAHASTWNGFGDGRGRKDVHLCRAGGEEILDIPYMVDEIYPPRHHSSSAYSNSIVNDYVGSFAEPTNIPAPVYSGPMLTGAYDSPTHHQLEPIYTPGPMLMNADASAAYTNPAPVYSGPTLITQAHAAYPKPAPAPPDFLTGASALYTPPQPVAQYAQPRIGAVGYSIDPRQLHDSFSTISDPQTAYEAPVAYAAHKAYASLGTPSLGCTSGSSASSASPTTPTGSVLPSVRALGKRKAMDAGFDGDHRTAQTSAQTDSRPNKRPRASSQAARVASTVDPRMGILNQTGAAALTNTQVDSAASGRGGQTPANPASEVLLGAGAGPSRALPKTRSRWQKKMIPVQKQDFVPLWKQGLTPKQVEEAAKKMDKQELIKNLTEKVVAISAPNIGRKHGKVCMCRWPGCDGHAERAADTGRHLEDIHLGRKMPCPKCGERFRRDGVKRHVDSKGCSARCHELEEQKEDERKAAEE